MNKVFYLHKKIKAKQIKNKDSMELEKKNSQLFTSNVKIQELNVLQKK